jgi:hypothetical protein
MKDKMDHLSNTVGSVGGMVSSLVEKIVVGRLAKKLEEREKEKTPPKPRKKSHLFAKKSATDNSREKVTTESAEL